MIQFAGKGILLDIEGTTSSVRFVQDVLLPYARRNLSVFLRYLWNDPAMPRIREDLAHFIGAESFEAWTGGLGMPPEARLAQLRQALLGLMDQGAKVGPLQDVQGLIWREGYQDGTLRSHVYADAVAKLKEWDQAGLDVRIYSSGSAEAQKVFFKHVDGGDDPSLDLTPHLQGYYDTGIGPKRESASYRKIAAAFGLPAGEILYFSDIPAELDAARAAGMRTALVWRPEDPPPDGPCDHPQVKSFAEVVVKRARPH